MTGLNICLGLAAFIEFLIIIVLIGGMSGIADNRDRWRELCFEARREARLLREREN